MGKANYSSLILFIIGFIPYILILFFISIYFKYNIMEYIVMLKDKNNKRYPIHEAFRISERELKNIEIIMKRYDLESRSQTIRYAINHFALKENI
jgi:uncharacterized membrane protein YsdA (DUF1294 family)